MSPAEAPAPCAAPQPTSGLADSTAPMRIVFSNYDTPGNPYYGGGGARAIHEVALRLARRHKVEVLGGGHPGAKPAEREGVRYRYLGPSAAGPKLGQVLFPVLLMREARRTACDVWIESLTPPFSTACLPKFTRAPVAALTQVLAGEGMRRKYRLPFDRFERIGLQAYRYAIATSKRLRERLLEINPRLLVETIPNGVRPDWIRAPLARREEHILFLGRIDIGQKGLDLLAEALDRARGRLPVPALLVGSGAPADERRLERLFARRRLDGLIRRLPRVGEAEKAELYRRAMFLVLPSRYEASPLVLPEAFCFGVPAIMFHIPDLGEYPEAACVKVPPFDAAAFAEAMVALAQDAPRRRRMSRAAKEAALGYDWDRLAARYEAFLAAIGRSA